MKRPAKPKCFDCLERSLLLFFRSPAAGSIVHVSRRYLTPQLPGTTKCRTILTSPFSPAGVVRPVKQSVSYPNPIVADSPHFRDLNKWRTLGRDWIGHRCCLVDWIGVTAVASPPEDRFNLSLVVGAQQRCCDLSGGSVGWSFPTRRRDLNSRRPGRAPAWSARPGPNGRRP